MVSYKIHPIATGEFQVHEKSTLLYRQGFGEKMKNPILAYLIVGEGRNILVDTGGSDPEWARKHHHPIIQTDDMLILNVLRKCGLGPEDITCLVNTHLHWDHCWNNHLFPGKRIYVQRRELAFAKAPLPAQYYDYETEHIGFSPPFKKALEQYEAIEGDFTLFPGIDLVTLPGHTPGFQGVLVETVAGRYLVASDSLGIYKNWEGDERNRHIPPAIHVDLADCYATFDKIEKICDFILPGHDARVLEHDVYPATA
jgi:glyoxylase-like metal-dependent hydrolase (beta-lactamase superfamily II)